MRDVNTNFQVMMIDDDVKLCRLVREYLAPFGFDVSASHKGQ